MVERIGPQDCMVTCFGFRSFYLGFLSLAFRVGVYGAGLSSTGGPLQYLFFSFLTEVFFLK